MKSESKITKKSDNTVNLIAVGSIALDTIITPHRKECNLLGGSLSYACIAASFFTRSGMVGVVGDDFPHEYFTTYRSFRLDLSGLHIAAGKTFRWTGKYSADMNERHTICTELNVFATFTPELPVVYRNAEFVLLCNISPELQLKVLSQVNKPKFVIADTMDLWIRNARQKLRQVIRAVDMLIINETEARLLTGEYDVRQCAKALQRMGAKWVVIKKGEHGAVLFFNNQIFFVPAYPVNRTIDPTGAGDSFAGALIGWIARTHRVELNNIRAGLLYGTAVASFCVEDFGLNNLVRLRFHQIVRRVNEIKNMMSLPQA